MISALNDRFDHFRARWVRWASCSSCLVWSLLIQVIRAITFETLITQWLFNHCCYIILCERVLTNHSMFDSDEWKRMRSDHSLELSIFHVNRWMTWHQVKKMSLSFLNISAWSTSHYFFEHCNHDSQYLRWLFYLISFHQLLDDTVNVMKTFQYWRSWWIANSSITCSHNSQTLHLSCLFH